MHGACVHALADPAVLEQAMKMMQNPMIMEQMKTMMADPTVKARMQKMCAAAPQPCQPPPPCEAAPECMYGAAQAPAARRRLADPGRGGDGERPGGAGPALRQDAGARDAGEAAGDGAGERPQFWRNASQFWAIL